MLGRKSTGAAHQREGATFGPMQIAIVPVVVMILGLVVWAVASKPLVAAVGEKMFTCGLLVTLFVFARVMLRLP